MTLLVMFVNRDLSKSNYLGFDIIYTVMLEYKQFMLHNMHL